MWNPEQYARFADQRSRPFHELVDRVLADPADVRRVVDLGCGPGTLTTTLCARWPHALVTGVDNDEAMLASARAIDDMNGRLRFASGDLRSWRADDDGKADVVIANAALQWDVEHVARMPHFVSLVARGGWFAFQVPGNLDDNHHQAIRSLRNAPRWRGVGDLASVPDRTHVSSDPGIYADALAPFAQHLDVWETTYLHILQGDDPVLEWVKGTGLRPVLNALPNDEARETFCNELAPMLRDAYPTRSYGTPFPFRRVFAVAHRH